MSKKLSNYLHFYVGCKILITDTDGQQFVDKVESVIKDNAGNRFSIYDFGDMPFENHEEYYQDAQPLLRSLYDITDDELIELADKNQTNCLPYGWKQYKKYKVIRLNHPNKGVELNVLDKYALRITNNKALYFYDYTEPSSAYFVSESFEMVAYLLNMQFDLFGLIESGIAIDKQKYHNE